MELKKQYQLNQKFDQFIEFEEEHSYRYFFPESNFERIFIKYKEVIAKSESQQRVIDKMKRKM